MIIAASLTCLAAATAQVTPPRPGSLEQEIKNTETQTEKEKETMVTIKTTKGDITLKLFNEEAPETVANFIQYAKDGHYNDTIFHRVIDNFMIQGGGFTQDMQQKPTRAPIKNEAANGLKNKRGTIAMARTQVIDSATSQFFINVADNAFLNYRDPSVQGFGYCVFGEVTDGMDVVEAIKSVKTGSHGPFQDVPADPVVITEVSISE
jgi:peptidyl-prolyl cis-trans isomerase B (cyclophilin B)